MTGKGMAKAVISRLQPKPGVKAVVKPRPKVAVAVKVQPIPVGERYNERAQLDPLGTKKVTGEPWEAERLKASEPKKPKGKTGTSQKEERPDVLEARKHGYTH